MWTGQGGPDRGPAYPADEGKLQQPLCRVGQGLSCTGDCKACKWLGVGRQSVRDVHGGMHACKRVTLHCQMLVRNLRNLLHDSTGLSALVQYDEQLLPAALISCAVAPPPHAASPPSVFGQQPLELPAAREVQKPAGDIGGTSQLELLASLSPGRDSTTTAGTWSFCCTKAFPRASNSPVVCCPCICLPAAHANSLPCLEARPPAFRCPVPDRPHSTWALFPIYTSMQAGMYPKCLTQPETCSLDTWGPEDRMRAAKHTLSKASVACKAACIPI